MVADWLSGTTLDAQAASQAVTVHLAAMGYDGSDTNPGLAGGIVDETRNDNAARDDVPASLPALVVSVQELEMDAGAMIQTEQRGTARVLIRYVASNTDSSAANRDSYYVARAVRRSLERLHLPQEATNARRRNNVAILADSAEPMKLVKVQAAREDGTVTAAWIVSYHVWDLAV
jgi:hypothetical protein